MQEFSPSDQWNHEPPSRLLLPDPVLTKKIQNRRNRSVASVLVALGAATLAVACGGDGDDSGGTGGMNNTDLGDGISTDGSNTGNPDFDSSEGGKVDLDAEDIQAIEEASCTGWAAEGESLPATLQLVVDVELLDDGGSARHEPEQVEVTRDALSQAIEDLPASVAVGVLYYPNGDVQFSADPQPIDACVDADGDGSHHPAARRGRFQPAQYAAAVAASCRDGRLHAHARRVSVRALNEGLVPYTGNGNQKFMLLITDGAPTMSEGCVSGDDQQGDVIDMPTQPIIDEIAGANDQGIRTFLIGSPGSEESAEETGGDMRPWPSRAAVEGGTAADGCEVDGPNFCHMDMTQTSARPCTSGMVAESGRALWENPELVRRTRS